MAKKVSKKHAGEIGRDQEDRNEAEGGVTEMGFAGVYPYTDNGRCQRRSRWAT
jgi:hypothetical protein